MLLHSSSVSACPFSLAAWTSDPAINLQLTDAVRNQGAVESVTDGAGGAIVLWRDLRNQKYEIFASRVSSNGDTPWDVSGVPVHQTTVSSIVSNLRAIPDGTGGAIVTWSYTLGSSRQVRAQKVDGTGQIRWAPDGVILTTTFYPGCAAPCVPGALISDGNGGAIVTWDDSRNGAADVYAQRIDANGNALWGASGIPVCTATNDQRAPRITSDLLGGAIVAWADYRSGTADVFAQRVDGNGSALWSVDGVAVTDSAGPQSYADLVGDGDSGAIVTWYDGGPNANSFAQRIDKFGTRRWSPNGGVKFSGYTLGRHMLEDGASGAFVLFEGGHRLHRLGADGELLWGLSGFEISTFVDAEAQEMTTDGHGGVIVVWSNLVGAAWDVNAQRINPAGNRLWGTGGVLVSTALGDQYGPAIVPSSAGGAIMSWPDSRNGTSNWDVYSQQVSAEGQLGETVSDVSSFHSAIEFGVASPARGGAMATFTLQNRFSVAFRVTDVAGRVMDRIVLGELPAGTYTRRFDVRRYPSGVYLLQLEAHSQAPARKLVVLD